MSRRSGRFEDMGDIVIHTEWLLKGKHWTLVFHVGSHRDIAASERPAPVPAAFKSNPERIDLIMDLGADKKVQLTVAFQDELGNAVTTPDGATVAWTVDDTTIVALIDEVVNESIWAAATGVLGSAIVSVSVTMPNSTVVTGDLLINVVAGEAERVAIVAGAPVEVTPDEPPTP